MRDIRYCESCRQVSLMNMVKESIGIYYRKVGQTDNRVLSMINVLACTNCGSTQLPSREIKV